MSKLEGGGDQGRRQPRLSRRQLLGVAGVAAAAGIGAAASEETQGLRRPHGPHDLAAATVPPGPDDRLTQLEVTWRVATTRRAVALTFDDGPDPRWTPAVLRLLRDAGARATFFVCGASAQRHPDLVRAAAALGEVGNHSWDHPDLALAGTAAVDRQLERTHELLRGLLGRPPTLVRPPYGTTVGPVLVAAARLQCRLVLWSDEVQRGSPPAAADVRRVLGAVRPGEILLAHDGRGDRSGVLERLPGLLEGLARQGFEVTTVGDLLAGAGQHAG